MGLDYLYRSALLMAESLMAYGFFVNTLFNFLWRSIAAEVWLFHGLIACLIA